MLGTVLDKITTLVGRSFVITAFFPVLLLAAAIVFTLDAAGFVTLSGLVAQWQKLKGLQGLAAALFFLVTVAIAYQLMIASPVLKRLLEGAYTPRWLGPWRRKFYLERFLLRRQEVQEALRRTDAFRRAYDAARTILASASQAASASAPGKASKPPAARDDSIVDSSTTALSDKAEIPDQAETLNQLDSLLTLVDHEIGLERVRSGAARLLECKPVIRRINQCRARLRTLQDIVPAESPIHHAARVADRLWQRLQEDQQGALAARILVHWHDYPDRIALRNAIDSIELTPSLDSLRTEILDLLDRDALDKARLDFLEESLSFLEEHSLVAARFSPNRMIFERLPGPPPDRVLELLDGLKANPALTVLNQATEALKSLYSTGFDPGERISYHLRLMARWEDEVEAAGLQYAECLSDAQAHFAYTLGTGAIQSTALGNVLTAARTYPFTRYGIDSSLLWPRLQKVIPSDYFRVVEDARISYDFSVTMAFLVLFHCVFSAALLVYLIVAHHHPTPPGWFILLPLASALLATVLYWAAFEASVSFGAIFRSCFDLFRFSLMEQLHLPLPPDIQSERKTWNTLNQILLYADVRLPLKYSHPEKSTAETAGDATGASEEKKEEAGEAKKKVEPSDADESDNEDASAPEEDGADSSPERE